ncbi:MAG: class I SAM-dependent methyltransferase [Phycisphaeraceae bacterium]|nr:class I SAM-dependent methyltransferase [Phycisphaeraceae bacterium]
MAEINLLNFYPKADRPIDERGKMISEEVRAIARQYGREFFDGDRLYGYGGYKYDGRWVPIVRRIAEHYQLAPNAAVLDVGCAKGFMLHDFRGLMPGATLAGLDVSGYAIEHAMPSVKDCLTVGCASELPYPDKSFDLVLSINTVHNLPAEKCRKALQEIMRVTRGAAFVTVDAWRTEEERQRLLKWVLTAHTYMSTEAWKTFFEQSGYSGDYYWFIA